MKHSIVILAASLLALSCEENAIVGPGPTVETVADFYPMSVGSYWVYDVIFTDSSGAVNGSITKDSVVVEKDTLIGGVSYRLIRSQVLGESCNRDSAGFIVSSEGYKVLSIDPNSGLLQSRYYVPNDTSFYWTVQLLPQDSVYSVPAGTFSAKRIKGTMTGAPNQPDFMKERTSVNALAKGVGCVHRRAFFLMSPNFLEFRLVRYHIQ
jgi:hypothetical protein